MDDLIAFLSRRPRAPNGPTLALGLAIVKSIMALQGGTVSVQSELGKGSTYDGAFGETFL